MTNFSFRSDTSIDADQLSAIVKAAVAEALAEAARRAQPSLTPEQERIVDACWTSMLRTVSFGSSTEMLVRGAAFRSAVVAAALAAVADLEQPPSPTA